jgi:hypothetical protein
MAEERRWKEMEKRGEIYAFSMKKGNLISAQSVDKR